MQFNSKKESKLAKSKYDPKKFFVQAKNKNQKTQKHNFTLQNACFLKQLLQYVFDEILHPFSLLSTPTRMKYILILSVLKSNFILILNQNWFPKNIEYVITCQILPIFCMLRQIFLQIMKVNALAQLTFEFLQKIA